MNINPKQIIAAALGWLLLIILLLISLFSCGPAKRLERLHKNNPYLFVNIKDTIKIRDTIIVKIPGTNIDTSFNVKYLYDTITIEKQGVRTIIYRKQGTDTVFVNTTVREKTITLPYSKDVVTNRYDYKEPPKKPISHPFMPIILFVILVIVLMIINHLSKQKWIDLF